MKKLSLHITSAILLSILNVVTVTAEPEVQLYGGTPTKTHSGAVPPNMIFLGAHCPTCASTVKGKVIVSESEKMELIEKVARNCKGYFGEFDNVHSGCKPYSGKIKYPGE